jgi:pimeloyl-ACP methyl ester carboxylesterase
MLLLLVFNVFKNRLTLLSQFNLLIMFFKFSGSRISYNDSGQGKPVVLLHGYLETSEVWQDFAVKLSEKFRVIVIDLPGHGLSDTFGSNHTMEFMATVIRELLGNLGLNKVFLTGHSLGGYVTLAFLDLFPDSLSGYCLFHSQPFPDTPETIEKRMREIALVNEGNTEMFYPGNITKMYGESNLELFSEAVQRSKAIASRLNGKGIIALLNGMIERPSRLSVMQEGRVPCLWILGAMDNYISCKSMQLRVKMPANARLVVLKNSGHMGFIEEEDLSIKILSDFVGSLS